MNPMVKSNTWFTSDHHYGHKNIINLSKRPFEDLHTMHKALTLNHNKLIQPNDRVFIVGDFSFAQASETVKYVRNLNGRKILIQGNHDKGGEDRYLQMGFELVLQQAQLKIGGRRVNMSHYPYLGSPEEIAHAEAEGYRIRHLDLRPHNDGNWLIHGHVHGAWKTRGKMINVGVDVWDYKPVSLSQIESIMALEEQNDNKTDVGSSD